LIDAQLLWNDPRLLEIPAKTEDELRYLVIGLINGKHWSAVITYRSTHIRLISVRRSRAEEVALHESKGGADYSGVTNFGDKNALETRMESRPDVAQVTVS
jgi:hypothetical protein